MRFLAEEVAQLCTCSVPSPSQGAALGEHQYFDFSLQDLGFVVVPGDHHEEGEGSDPGAGNCWVVSYAWN